MNNSTENVTLLTAFINDILNEFKGQEKQYPELFALAVDVDLDDIYAHVPMSIYNDMCTWIENNLGDDKLITVGKNIGNTIYDTFFSLNIIDENASPFEMMEALVTAAETMIDDPEGRGWEILENERNHILMRRTQTFNSKLQFGLLDGLVKRSGKNNILINYKNAVAQGAEFDDYRIEWED